MRELPWLLPDIFSLRRPNNHSTMFESYLNLIGGKGDKCTFYTVNENQVTRSPEEENVKYHLVLLQSYPKQWETLKGILEEIKGNLVPGGEIHIVIRTLQRKGIDLKAIWTRFCAKRILHQFRFTNKETYGIFPSVDSPGLFVPFKKNVYQFVVTKYFRNNNYPLKHMIKQIMVSYLGSIFWRGDIVVVGKNG